MYQIVLSVEMLGKADASKTGAMRGDRVMMGTLKR